MLNVVNIMGRLVRDPDIRKTTSGISTASFTVAVERDYKSGSEKETDFIQCVAWRQTADFLCKYFHKGDMIVISGSLQSRKWVDKSGSGRTSFEVVANHVYFGQAKPNTESAYGAENPRDFVEIEDDGILPF